MRYKSWPMGFLFLLGSSLAFLVVSFALILAFLSIGCWLSAKALCGRLARIRRAREFRETLKKHHSQPPTDTD